MDKILKQMTEKLKELKKSREIAESVLKKSPKGRLRISKSKKGIKYYQVVEKYDTTGKYINRHNFEMAEKLAQKDYCIKFIKEVDKVIMKIEESIEILMNCDANKVYGSLRQERKQLVIPFIKDDESYASEWEEADFNKNKSFEENLKYETEKGELVRSKSELLIANMYYSMGIPYRYECGVKFKNGVYRYPDFTLLNVKTRQVIYHEHLGLLDDSDYRKNNLAKLDEYRKNGIFTGKNLILTYEGVGSVFDIKELKKAVKEIFV